jgi:hypothetical protein
MTTAHQGRLGCHSRASIWASAICADSPPMRNTRMSFRRQRGRSSRSIYRRWRASRKDWLSSASGAVDRKQDVLNWSLVARPIEGATPSASKNGFTAQRYLNALRSMVPAHWTIRDLIVRK